MSLKRQIALDTETTGKSDDGTPGDHRIIEIGCVEIINRKVTGNNLQIYLNPQRAIDEEAFAVHGISNEMLQDKPFFADIAGQFIKYVEGAELLIHNAKFDTGFLDKEFSLIGFNKKINELCTVVDTYTLARKINPNNQASLDNLCNIYDIDNSRRTMHGALLDAQILAEVYLAMTGGQSSFNFEAQEQVSGSKWVRPQNIKLPLMEVEEDRAALHLQNMLELALANKSTDAEGNEIALSFWSNELNMPYLSKGEDEGKKDYQKRLKEQREQKLLSLITYEQKLLLDEYLKQDLAAYLEWVHKVKNG